jgi:hypothetical protein
MSATQLLTAVHLSDNGIMLNEKLRHNILDIFGIHDEDVDQDCIETIGHLTVKDKVN